MPPRRSRRAATNVPLPVTPTAPAAKRRYHYIVERLDEANDVELLAAALNDRAAQGYKLHQSHFYGTTAPQATLIFVRRLRAPKREKAAQPRALTPFHVPDLDKPCTECDLGGRASALPALTDTGIAHVKATGKCPNCDTTWPTMPAVRITESEA
jgi:hypothetical protein